MQAHKYTAPTIREATEKVKRVLGPAAMILETRRLIGPRGEPLFEITAGPPRTEESRGPETGSSSLAAELMSIKDMLQLMQHTGGTIEKIAAVPALLNLYVTLVRKGVQEQNVAFFFERAGAFHRNPPPNPYELRRQVMQEMSNAVSVRDPFQRPVKKQTIAALVGTTGVGKTTTIAKLAARLSLKDGRRVGLVSIDTYRIGAMEQLKSYADIIGIPCLQAFNRKDMAHAVKRMVNRDVILIDTAGQSQYDKQRLRSLAQFLCSDAAISTHLLLSAATLETEVEKTARNFESVGYETCVFTKTDETTQHGRILNQALKLKRPLSYFTTGQNVPEDIENAHGSRMVDMIFGDIELNR